MPADPRPAAVTITPTPALYTRAREAGMPEGERAIAEWLVSRAEVAATARREALEEAARECEGLGKTTTTGSIVGGVCDRVAAKIRELAKKEAP